VDIQDEYNGGEYFGGEGEKLVLSGALFVKYKLWSYVIQFLSV